MIRLIASDMDGTLLDSAKRLPQGLLPVLRTLRERGTMFAVASGRQYAALLRDMQAVADDILFICENGALVMERGKRLHIDPMPVHTLAGAIRAARALDGVWPVLCRAEVALVERGGSQRFMASTRPYYPSLQVVDDLLDYCGSEDVCKVAFYDEGDAQTHELPALQEKLSGELSVILSGANWVDVMRRGVHKGAAMRALQEKLRIAPEECMAFGDYLNDCERLDCVGESYAMANAHPRLKEVARYIAPCNDEDGVMRVIRERFSL